MANEVERMSPHSGQAYDSESSIVDIVSKAGVLSADNNCERLNAGKLYVATHIFEGVANNASVYMLFETGDKAVKSSYQLNPSGSTEWRVYANPTITANGTLATICIRNQTTDGVVNATNVYHTPSVTDNGTLLTERKTSGEGRFSLGGGEDDRSLKIPPNTQILYEFTSKEAVGDDISVEIDWSEED